MIAYERAEVIIRHVHEEEDSDPKICRSEADMNERVYICIHEMKVAGTSSKNSEDRESAEIFSSIRLHLSVVTGHSVFFWDTTNKF